LGGKVGIWKQARGYEWTQIDSPPLRLPMKLFKYTLVDENLNTFPFIPNAPWATHQG
jgi:hypothetical protein